MTVEQMIEMLQELIGRGTVSPNAEIVIDISSWEIITDIEVDLYATTYNRLYLR